LFSKEMTYKQATKHLYDLCQQLHEMVNKKLLPSRQYNQNKICLHKMICRLNAIVLKHIKILVALLHLGFTEDDAINFVNFWKNPNRHDSYYCANECWQEFLRNQIKRDRKDACCWDMAKNCWKSEAKIFICENCLVTKIFEELLKKELREYALK
ncbi:hypothetical protein KAU11_05640, partial [Candidatus Babeliales bacterium]|nr:hypothetical protein [Candidatus Babeliales bacterium]